MREAVMSGMVLADDSLINLFPDPAWDVAGFRDLAGGVIAVCLYAAVAMVIVGVLTLLPGLITNNMMERAFSWKRLLCALMIPLTIGAATGGFAWGAGAFGADGLAVNDSYQSANGHPDWKGVKSDEAKIILNLFHVIETFNLDTDSMWYRKSNFFTMFVELSKVSQIPDDIVAKIHSFEDEVLANKGNEENDFGKYYSVMYTGTNSRSARIKRADIFYKYCLAK